MRDDSCALMQIACMLLHGTEGACSAKNESTVPVDNVGKRSAHPPATTHAVMSTSQGTAVIAAAAEPSSPVEQQTSRAGRTQDAVTGPDSSVVNDFTRFALNTPAGLTEGMLLDVKDCL